MTNNNFPNCRRDECLGPETPSHPDAYHEADGDIIDAASQRSLIKKWDEFFDAMREECLDYLPHPLSLPLGAEVDDDEDLFDDFADWGTMQIIRAMMR